MEYPINKGAGNPIEFKGLKSQYLFIFAGGLVAVLLGGHPVFSRREPVDMHSFGNSVGFAAGLADLPPECPVR